MLIDWNEIQVHKLPEKIECFSRSEIEQIISALQKRCLAGYMRRNDALPRSCLIGNNGQIYVLGKGNSTEKIYEYENRNVRWCLHLNTMQLVIAKTSSFDKFDDESDMREATGEIELLKEIQGNPLFVQIKDSCKYPSRIDDTKVLCITEWCNEGDFIEFYDDSGKELYKIFPFLFQILVELDKLKILHRDIKPDNIFIHTNEDGVISVKLGDFGLAMTQEKAKIRCLIDYEVFGTPGYKSPEVCEFNAYLDKDLLEQVCSTKTDVWSMGVVIFRRMFGSIDIKFTQEWIDSYLNDNLEKVWFKEKMEPNQYTALCECLRGMLKVDPKERLTGQQLVEKYNACT